MDDLQQLQLLQSLRRKEPIRKYLKDPLNPIEYFNENNFIQRYRLSKEVVIDLLQRLDGDLISPSNKGLPIPPILQLTSVLRFYATGCFQIVAGDLEGVSQPMISRLVLKVSEAIAKHLNEFIRFPTDEQHKSEIAHSFYSIGQFPGVIGAIDCTHIRIQAPGGEDSELFRNRKGFHSINCQAICDANLMLTNVVARWRGSVHDSRIFENSNIGMAYENGQMHGGILLGDGGYPCKPYLLTPIQNPTTRAEMRYNKAHVKCRNTIERTFGVWKRIFPCLAVGMRLKTSTTLTVIVATAVLYNLARARRYIIF